jgi:hypothetical protein
MRITINIKQASEIDRVPHLRELIRLCHISNALDFMIRQTVQNSPESATPKRNTAYALIYVSSLVYEAMLSAYSLLRKMAEVMPKFIRGEMAWILTEVDSPTSFWKVVLEPVRNEVGFHFSNGLIKNPFESTIPQFPPVLAEAQHEDGTDLVFTLPCDIFTGYLATLGDQSKPSEERVAQLVGQIAEYSTRVLRVIHTSIMAITIDDKFDYNVEDGNTA